METFSVELDKVVHEMKLEKLYYPERKIWVETADLNRPGLQIAGFFDYFDPKRIQVFGKVESTYLATMSLGGALSKFEKTL